MSETKQTLSSSAVEALKAAGDVAQAEDVADLEAAQSGSDAKLKSNKASLTERLIFGPPPSLDELSSGADYYASIGKAKIDEMVYASRDEMFAGNAFTADNKLSDELRAKIASYGGYGLTLPKEYGGLAYSYNQLAYMSEQFSANGLSSVSIEISGQLTIGASALLGYGTEQQRQTFLPLIASGDLIAFALTEVGVGVNAKRVQTYVEEDKENNCWRLHAEGARNKLYITNAAHGALAAIVARKGKTSKEIGLFIVRLPDQDVSEGDYQFSCKPSNVSAFSQNINSRVSFSHFPVPFENEIKGNGVEVLFYCLRLGRCILAAQCAGIQRSMAVDVINYARQREGVGGKVIKHELPLSNICKILSGALMSRALSHLSLAQDSTGVNLAGLRDLTKSASSEMLQESLYAAEKVMGGRTLDLDARLTQLRPICHAFGIVEGENDLIRLGMVKDVTTNFTNERLAGLLAVLQQANTDADGKPVAADKRIDKLNLNTFLHMPVRSMKACYSLVSNEKFYHLVGSLVRSAASDTGELVKGLVPASFSSRYGHLPKSLQHYVKYAERGLRHCRWHYIGLNLKYQLELTRAQVPMLQLGKRIETLMCILILASHASKQDKVTQALAVYRCAEMVMNLDGVCGSQTQKQRKAIEEVARALQKDEVSLLDQLIPEPFAHQWDEQ
ncbi:acyl-CoA dehydrogenase family protein [Alteromonas lipolytica]|uniref:Acyl-CoA dehydrogenase n=1 Tax=Alteromonas lipolytica TaxID=1856405 RepID=A0A1E8FC64_9ALTE|nr:acyl-CoA dehydrogenase family protein [Alteromonas lipolytica]OFI33517.1 acyl-CoA dehydrogenase [Alteromonas lipolytica]GGF58970.1 hypothetical protein GCM10011338_09060 [Alteromonas lipolytica]